MRKTNQRYTLAAAGLLASAAVGATAHAQSADALIDKLVDKGILTSKEAQDLRDEADKNFTTAYAVKSGLQDWVTSLKINGDLRGRFENFSSDGAFSPPVDGNSHMVDRTRFRYRLRAGITAVLKDNFEVGFRLTSSDPQAGNFGGDPISGNTTFRDNATKKYVYFDLVYGKWTPLNTPLVNGSVTVGKMENPFVFSDMVFDGDYTPEGAAVNLGLNLSDKQALKLNLGGFALDEVASQSEDPYLGGAQLRLDSTWSPKLATSVGVAGLMIMSRDYLSNADVPNVNAGNTRGAVNRPGEPASSLVPAYNFNPIVADASLTFTLDRAPFYAGPFPIKVGGDYMYNPAAPSSADNYAYSAGVTFGKAGKKGTWELQYTWKYLGANSWYEELVDSDFGAFYAASPATWGITGNVGGVSNGTNVKGHILKASYSPFDSITLSAKWFLTQQITVFPVGGATYDLSRLQVDAVWKF